MAMKSLGLAALALGCSMGIAVAENKALPAAPPTPQQEQVLKAFAAQHAATAKTAGAAATGSKAEINHVHVSAQISLGWHTVHATHCGYFLSSNGDQFFYIFSIEGASIFAINNLFASQGLQVPCGEGFFISWHVVDSSTGAYDQTVSYDFK